MCCASLLETVTEKSATPVLLAAINGRQTMKYICLGYYDKSKHDAMTEAIHARDDNGGKRGHTSELGE
jgi:hypothetical protein